MENQTCTENRVNYQNIMSLIVAWFDAHKSSASRDIIYLIYYVTLQKYVIKGARNFKDGSSYWYVTTLTILVILGMVLVEI